MKIKRTWRVFVWEYGCHFLLTGIGIFFVHWAAVIAFDFWWFGWALWPITAISIWWMILIKRYPLFGDLPEYKDAYRHAHCS